MPRALSYLLDTSMLSELRRRPAARVARWFADVEGEELLPSVLVVGEIRQGSERLRPRDGAQAAVFERWLETPTPVTSERLIAIAADHAVLTVAWVGYAG